MEWQRRSQSTHNLQQHLLHDLIDVARCMMQAMLRSAADMEYVFVEEVADDAFCCGTSYIFIFILPQVLHEPMAAVDLVKGAMERGEVSAQSLKSLQ